MDSQELRGLMEAYNAIYAPQEEISEEQIWEEVEEWVNSLVEEGHDLSEFTWEEMYESYLSEMGQKGGGRVTGSNPNVWKPTPSTSGPAGGGMGGKRGGGSSPGSVKPSAKPAAAPAAKPVEKPAAKPAAAKPSAATAAKPAAPSSGTRPAALPSAAKVEPAKPAAEPKIKKDVADLKSMQAASQERQKTSTPQLSARAQALKAGGPQGGARERMLNQSFDMFDVVKGHLIDEGYAETEEAALAIMANMSDAWKMSIISQTIV